MNRNKMESEEKNEEKFNNTDVYSADNNKYSTSNYETNNVVNEDEIAEDIITGEPIEVNEKEKSGSMHNYTSSQTFGYDNSVTSYNLDFYDYVEEVDKE